MTIKRRDFFKVTIAGTAAGVASQCTTDWEPYDDGYVHPGRIEAGPEKLVRTVCLQCPGGCGIEVRVIGKGRDQRAVKIEGNPDYPSNMGSLCPKGLNGLQVLYDPDRIRTPLKRTGMRGQGKWEAISAEAAIKEVASRLKRIRDDGESHTMAVLGGRYRGHMHDLVQRFLEAYGSPNDIDYNSNSSEGSKHAHYFTQGFKDYAAYDILNTKYLLSFGASIVEAARPTARFLRAYAYIKRGRPGLRAKIVVVDTRLSVSAAKADEWVPIKTGRDGALALGIAHVIIRDRLYNKEFISKHTFGFEDWADENGLEHIGFKSLVMDGYTPGRVSEITDVPSKTIERIAKEFAAAQPGIALGERGSSAQTNGVYNRMAIHSLNALVGSIDVPGGVLMQRDPPFKKWGEFAKDETAANGLSKPRLDYAGSAKFPFATSCYSYLPNAILSETPYKLNALLIYYTNPLFSTPNASRFQKAFEKTPFIVSFSPFMDESTQMADIVIPDHTYLERWQDDIIQPSVGFPLFGIRRPVVKPLYDTKSTGDVIIEIAKGIGGTVGDAFPWEDYKEAASEAIDGVYEKKSGSIVASTKKDFMKELYKKGGWWDENYEYGKWEEVFKTPSGKFEFYSQNMKLKLEEIARKEAEKKGDTVERQMAELIKGLQLTVKDDRVFMPHYEPIRFLGNETDYPLILNTYKGMMHAEGRGANQPFLQESFGVHIKEAWEPWVELNPETARKYTISDGDMVWVESPIGKIKLQAKLYPGARPDVVNIPYECGHKSYGRWAKDRGVNPNLILADQYDYLGGFAAFFSTRVRVYKA